MARPQAVTGEGLEPRTSRSLFNGLGHGIGSKSPPLEPGYSGKPRERPCLL